MKKIACPRCTQDWVKTVHINPLNIDAFLCFECDALWLDSEKLGKNEFVDYGTFMRSKGIENFEGKGIVVEVPDSE